MPKKTKKEKIKAAQRRVLPQSPLTVAFAPSSAGEPNQSYTLTPSYHITIPSTPKNTATLSTDLRKIIIFSLLAFAAEYGIYWYMMSRGIIK